MQMPVGEINIKPAQTSLTLTNELVKLDLTNYLKQQNITDIYKLWFHSKDYCTNKYDEMDVSHAALETHIAVHILHNGCSYSFIVTLMEVNIDN